MLQQHGTHRAYIYIMERAREAVAQFQYLPATLLLVLGTYAVRYFQCPGAGTLAVWEDVVLRHRQGCHKFVSLTEEFFRLAARTHDGVHTDKGIGHKFKDTLHLAAEEVRVVFPAHQAQHLVTATLQRYMEMWHKGTAVGTKLQHLVGQQVRLYAGNAITLYPLHRVQGLQESQETLACGLAKVAYVHSRDNYLLGSGLDGLLRLCHQ